jgi:hypothetical protein
VVAAKPVLSRRAFRSRVLQDIEKVESPLMTNKTSPRVLLMPKNLKRSFENAVRDIYEVGLTGKVSSYRTPIVQRSGIAPTESYVSAEKRALSDAAKALAQLWNISPSSR